jgi:hypothetical protein
MVYRRERQRFKLYSGATNISSTHSQSQDLASNRVCLPSDYVNLTDSEYMISVVMVSLRLSANELLWLSE